MPENGHFGPKISNIKLMFYKTVEAKVLIFDINLSYIIVQLRVQYENSIFNHLGAIGLLLSKYTPK